MTYVEAKFGSRTRDSKPSDTGSRGHSDPKDVDAISSLSSGSPSLRGGCFKCGGADFQRDCNVHVNPRKGKALERVGKVRETENPKEHLKVPRVPQVRTRVKPRKKVYLVLNIRNQRQVQKLWNLHKRVTRTLPSRSSLGVMVAGVTMSGTMSGVRLDGMKVGDQTHDISASSFSLWSLDLGAMRSPKWCEWVTMNLDTRAGVNTCPLNFGPDGA